ncbi:hypothetical protein ATY41_03205 [Leifsonia xyli subsp. xyli]|uniref:Transcriptional regulator, TetR family n=2 Tax=Leifsonia xyli subsp. xyli TaxID=59736 RepID=Q6ACC5_LEIXX|nr:TetR family transcriptional regulator [Leifsonia xyli]AAT89968.1 transcriptional regulator, TetR family [Leifsonia xyli subsp. xyli str. CTCB07]ODA90050.1 hypothetical protein ATY41_03205 [Leifsonia xyli subsp. xyli]
MAWDTERTRTLLLEAATAEFATHGIAGGRIDRIALAAGINKERLYSYFGGKETLFDTVLEHQLSRAGDDVPPPAADTGPGGVADYAAGLLARHRSDPSLARLLLWEGLERGKAVAAERRASQAAEKAAAIAGALPGMTTAQAQHLLLTILTLANAWATLPNLTGMCGQEGEALVSAIRSAVLTLAESAGAPAAGRRPRRHKHPGVPAT